MYDEFKELYHNHTRSISSVVMFFNKLAPFWKAEEREKFLFLMIKHLNAMPAFLHMLNKITMDKNLSLYIQLIFKEPSANFYFSCLAFERYQQLQGLLAELKLGDDIYPLLWTTAHIAHFSFPNVLTSLRKIFTKLQEEKIDFTMEDLKLILKRLKTGPAWDLQNWLDHTHNLPHLLKPLAEMKPENDVLKQAIFYAPAQGTEILKCWQEFAEFPTEQKKFAEYLAGETDYHLAFCNDHIFILQKITCFPPPLNTHKALKKHILKYDIEPAKKICAIVSTLPPKAVTTNAFIEKLIKTSFDKLDDILQTYYQNELLKFSKIYNALYSGSTFFSVTINPYQEKFGAYQENAKAIYQNIKAQVEKERPNSMVKFAWKLAEETAQLQPTNSEFFKKIYYWCFKHSVCFSRSKVTGHTFFRQASLEKAILQEGHIARGAKKENSRTARIYKCLTC